MIAGGKTLRLSRGWPAGGCGRRLCVAVLVAAGVLAGALPAAAGPLEPALVLARIGDQAITAERLAEQLRREGLDRASAEQQRALARLVRAELLYHGALRAGFDKSP